MPLDINVFFPDLNQFQHKAIFEGITYPWEAIKKIIPYIKEYLTVSKIYSNAEVSKIDGLTIYQVYTGEKMLFVERGIRITTPLFIHQANIYIGKGTLLEPGALIKSSVIIGDNCEVRQGAYIREGLITGNSCIVGHTTETKNSILMDHVEAGHFAYIGDSILGKRVNLGAGTKLANLQLRTPEEKDSGNIREIKIKNEGNIFNTEIQKLGAIIGDYGDIGCNTVTSPGTLLASNCWIYPNTTVKKGYYPQKTTIRNN